jgi:hypothetical protein
LAKKVQENEKSLKAHVDAIAALEAKEAAIVKGNKEEEEKDNEALKRELHHLHDAEL